MGRYGLTQLNYLVVIKLGVRNSFYLNWYRTGGNISGGDHPSPPNKSQDTSSTLFVTGVGLGYSMISFEKPPINPVLDSKRGVLKELDSME